MTAGAFVFGCAGSDLSREEATFFREVDPWGFILFDRNLEAPDQIRALCDDLRSAVGRHAPVLIDQEGGRVQRLRPPLARAWNPPLEDCEAAGPRAARAMFLRYRIIASELQELGIDVNCAPTADLARPETHAVLRNRCYGAEPGRVVEIARAVATGLMAGGVLPVMKHMPGHGRGTVDSHLEPPHVSADPATLHATDFSVFAALADLPLGMTAHLIFHAFDPNGPATTSPRMIQLIREQIGFGGLLMTDDLSMEALGGTVSDRARNAIAAGCDVILHCNGRLDEMQEVASAAGRMSEGGVAAGERALALRNHVQAIDIEEAEAEFEVLVQGRVHDRLR